jgi:ankyrin repeat protein
MKKFIFFSLSIVSFGLMNAMEYQRNETKQPETKIQSKEASYVTLTSSDNHEFKAPQAIEAISWDTLPKEIKVYILSFIALPSEYTLAQLRNLAYVSKNFKEVINMSSVKLSLIKKYESDYPRKFQQAFIRALGDNREELVALLLESGCNANGRLRIDSDGVLEATPLLLAIQHGYNNLVRLLIMRGACIDGPITNSTNHFKKGLRVAALDLNRAFNRKNGMIDNDVGVLQTPLIEAIQKSNKKIVKLLLSLGADPNLAGALNQAVVCGDKKIIRWLLLAGADLRKKDTDGRTPLMMAALVGDKNMKQFLLKQGASFTLRVAKCQLKS